MTHKGIARRAAKCFKKANEQHRLNSPWVALAYHIKAYYLLHRAYELATEQVEDDE